MILADLRSVQQMLQLSYYPVGKGPGLCFFMRSILEYSRNSFYPEIRSRIESYF